MSRNRLLRLLVAVFAGAFLVAACDAAPAVADHYHAPIDTWGSR